MVAMSFVKRKLKRLCAKTQKIYFAKLFSNLKIIILDNQFISTNSNIINKLLTWNEFQFSQ